MTRVMPGISALASEFDIFLVDIFGTLHDGRTAYPGAVAALRRLRDAGKKVVLLSNSGRRNAVNAARLSQYSLGEAEYDLLLTSGEVAWTLLRAGDLPSVRNARRSLLISRDNDRSIVDGLDLVLASGVDDADFVLLSGSEGERRPMAEYEALLAPAAKAGLPMICCNPDDVMLTETGAGFGSGRIAAAYADLGGAVTTIGKPDPAIYEAVFAQLRNPPWRNVIGIGDSLRHDVAGARAAGAASALVTTGIARDWRPDVDPPGRNAAEADFVLPGFLWHSSHPRSQTFARRKKANSVGWLVADRGSPDGQDGNGWSALGFDARGVRRMVRALPP